MALELAITLLVTLHAWTTVGAKMRSEQTSVRVRRSAVIGSRSNQVGGLGA